jgi:ribulose-5-phosphate 4-epimerase/fuculose-1-phosphate aldolase
MLVNSEKFGLELALKFSESDSSQLGHNVVLMANHGFTVVGTSVRQAVYRAVYTHKNAGIQSSALLLRSASMGPESVGAASGLQYLTEAQIRGTLQMNLATENRPWGLWVREVASAPMYVNELRDVDIEEEMPSSAVR